MSKTKSQATLNGWFDVKKYAKGVEKKDQKIIAEGEQIVFRTTYAAAELPAMFAAYAKPYESRDHEQRMAVKIKIGANCTWYKEDENGSSVVTNKPLNTELDGKRYDVMVEFSQLDGNPAEKEASGYWANSIFYREVPTNPFQGMRFESVAQATQANNEEEVF